MTHSYPVDLWGLVDEKTGVISRLEQIALDASDPKVFWFHAFGANTLPILGNKALNEGDGVSWDKTRAAKKAVGECIERYAAASYNSSDLVLSTYRNLSEEGTHPARFTLFEAEQYAPNLKLQAFDEDTLVAWARGFSHKHKSSVLAPAQFVFIPYQYADNEKVLDNQISTGLSCHLSADEAMMKGALEVVERDVFMLWWLIGTSATRLNTKYFAPGIRNYLEGVGNLGYQSFFLSLGSEFEISVVLTILISENQNIPKSVVGLGTSMNIERAVELSLEEVSFGLLGLRRQASKRQDFDPGPNWQNISSLDEHGLAFALEDELVNELKHRISETEELTQEQWTRKCRCRNDTFSDLLEVLENADKELITFDLTTPDIHSIGFSVYRSIIPGLQPMDINHQLRHRCRSISDSVGMEINTLPHPFP